MKSTWLNPTNKASRDQAEGACRSQHMSVACSVLDLAVLDLAVLDWAPPPLIGPLVESPFLMGRLLRGPLPKDLVINSGPPMS